MSQNNRSSSEKENEEQQSANEGAFLLSISAVFLSVEFLPLGKLKFCFHFPSCL
jgi:hypothetical protein